MARLGSSGLVSFLMMALLVISGPRVDGAITCSMVLSGVAPCLGYLQRGGQVPTACCDGIKSLNNAASTTPDLQEACRCVKVLVPRFGANANFVNNLPGACRVNIPYRYSPSVDCSKVTR